MDVIAALIPPVVMALVFAAVVVAIIRNQNR